MYAQTVKVLNKRGEDLRYVTEHFQDLQGARLAPLWAFFLASFLFESRQTSVRAILITVIAGVLVAVISYPWARKWYRNRYGVVIKPASPKSTSRWQVVVAVLIFGLVIWTILFHLFDKDAILAVVVVTEPILLPRCFDAVSSSGTLLRRMLYSATLVAMVALCAWSLFGGLSGRALMASMAACCLCLAIYDHYLLQHIFRSSTRLVENEDG